LSSRRGIINKEDVRIVIKLRGERYDEYLESTDDWRLCKDDMLYFTKRIGKRNFLDVIIKNYLPRVYRTVERLNVRYLSCEEVNIRRNDQECRVYKEKCMMRKIRERREKIRVKVVRTKVRGVRKRRNKGIRKGKEREERRSTGEGGEEGNKLID